MTWISLPPSPERTPPKRRCCDLCNTALSDLYHAAKADDPQLFMYAADFIHPVATPPSRPSSSLSVASDASQGSTSSYYRAHTSYQGRGLPETEIHCLRKDLEEQRDLMWQAHGRSVFLAPEVFLPRKQLNALVKAAPTFAKQRTTTSKSILAVIKLDFASDFDLAELAWAISLWRNSLSIIAATPPSQRRISKKPRVGDNITNMLLSPSRPRLVQPTFPCRAPSASGSSLQIQSTSSLHTRLAPPTTPGINNDLADLFMPATRKYTAPLPQLVLNRTVTGPGGLVTPEGRPRPVPRPTSRLVIAPSTPIAGTSSVPAPPRTPGTTPQSSANPYSFLCQYTP